ncbi:hypothetical protein [Thermoleptolyngbya sp. C42_A2020_037]|nr:hypothetical protein [Thermoleptolyngbya sp. C42_A2020_037]
MASDLIPTSEESAQAAEARAEAEQQRREKLAAKLRELDIDPDA